MREIEWLTVQIGDSPTRFFDDDRAGSLVPNSFSIIGLRTRNESEQNIAFTGCEDRIFRLAIHPDRCCGHTEVGGELADFVDVCVRFLDRTENAGGGRLRTLRHIEALPITARERLMPRALTSNCHDE